MTRKTAIIPLLLLSLLLSASLSASSASTSNTTGADNPFVYTITITGVITNGTTQYIHRSVELAESEGAAALVLLIDTPGGLVDATLEIIEILMASEVPVITYVEPQGAIAASAGSFILVSGHIAAMAPGTTCGAAMPVTLSFSEESSGTESADDKTIKFLAGHVRSIAEERGHNGDTAELFVTENLTLNADEALESGIIDLTARTVEDLLQATEGMAIDLQGQPHKMRTAGVEVRNINLTGREQATSFISNPQVSFLLVILGIYGLVIGFNAPHTYLPESAGAIAFLTGLYGLGMFDINLFAVVMLILGVLLLIAEAMTPTYGVLSIAGISSVVLGGFFLPREPLMPRAWLIGFRATTIGIGIGASLLMLIILRGIIRVRRRKAVHGKTEFAGLTGTVAEVNDFDCLVRVNGELWHGRTETNIHVTENEKVTVLRREGMVVIIAPLGNDVPSAENHYTKE